MAFLYRVIYNDKAGQSKAVVVSATTLDNAANAAKTNDSNHKQHVTVTQVSTTAIVSGS